MNLISLFNLPEQLTLSGRVFSIYFILGHLSFVFSIIPNLYFCYYFNLSYAWCAGLYLLALFTFYLLAFAQKLFTGYESYVLLRYALVVNFVVWLVLWLTKTATFMWHYLDFFAIALAMLIAIGRLGCQTIGCCHGKPGNCWVYTAYPFGKTGVPVRLVPVQFVESCYVFILLCGSLYVKFVNVTPGLVWSSFWELYLLGRFVLEFYRGDPDRPYRIGFSEAQWTSIFGLGLLVAGKWLGWVSVLTLLWWVVVPGLVVILLVLLYRLARKQAFYRLTEPANLMEFAQKAWQSLQNTRVEVTSLQIKVSASTLSNGQCLYTISHTQTVLPYFWAKRLLKYLSLTKYPGKRTKLVHENKGVFHLVILPEQH